ncbi:MAG: chloride channel protein [Planctomycetes bacterium]|nr:chloride channel protein [Planctomycetota bacterium]
MTNAIRALRKPGRRFWTRFLRSVRGTHLKDDYFLIVVSILIGVATGLSAHFFFDLIEWVGKLAFGQEGHGGFYTGRAWMLIVLPVVGALAVGQITYFLAREAKGHGVPEVMDALYRRGGVIRPRVAAAKAVASALTIGSGGSAGTEGPIIQIGAAIGSGVGQLLRIPPRSMSIVVACGVSAGIGAIFNAPIAGVLFALEIFLKDFSFRTFSPVVFSSVISCSIMHSLREEDVAIFEVGALRDVGYIFATGELPLFLVLGLVCALASVLFIRTLYFTEDLTDRIKIPEYLKPALGAAGLGLAGVAYVLVNRSEAVPAFYGNGYPAIQATLGHALMQMTVAGLLGLFLLKLLATCLTLGTGGSGGVFAPSLLMGATLGGAFGMSLTHAGIIDPSSTNAYALVGMAALVAGTTHAPLTAIVMLYEITREPKVILPVMLAAIVAMAAAQLLCRDSIYTLKLRRRGVRVGTVADLMILRRISVEEVERRPAPFVHPEDPLQSLIEVAGQTDATDFVVVDEQGAYLGMVTGRDIHTALLQPEAVSLLVVSELMHPGVPAVTLRDTLDLVLDRFARSHIESMPIASSTDRTCIIGLITRQAVMERYHEELERQAG